MRPRFHALSGQGLIGISVAVLAAVFVLYPIYFLLQASLNVGDPDAKPPTEYGLDNYAALPRYSQIMLNTLFVSFLATVMALVLGFLTAWIRNRTNLPFRLTLEQAMAVPYYVTPLLGAFASSLSAMDPSLEEASQVIGTGRLRTMLRVTLPLVAPGVLGAAIFVFAEMLGSFSVALVLGTPSRFYVITTAIYQLVSSYPPRIPLAAAMGVRCSPSCS